MFLKITMAHQLQNEHYIFLLFNFLADHFSLLIAVAHFILRSGYRLADVIYNKIVKK